jgi:hypothetical protein
MLFAAALLRDAVFDWIDLSLQKFIEKTSAEKIKDTKFMFMNYNKFKEEIWRAFSVIDEKHAVK